MFIIISLTITPQNLISNVDSYTILRTKYQKSKWVCQENTKKHRLQTNPYEKEVKPGANQTTHNQFTIMCLNTCFEGLNNILEPWHEISNNVVCATSKASDLSLC